MIKVLITVAYIISLVGCSVQCAHDVKQGSLNRKERDENDNRYLEIDQLDKSMLSYDEQIKLSTEAHTIAQKMITAIDILLQDMTNNNRIRMQNTKQDLIPKYTAQLTLWKIRLESSQSVLNVLELEQLKEQRETDTNYFLQQSNLLNSTNIEALQTHHNNVDKIHALQQKQLNSDPTNPYTQQVEKQTKLEKDMLSIFSIQMTRAKSLLQEKNTRLQEQHTVVESLKNNIAEQEKKLIETENDKRLNLLEYQTKTSYLGQLTQQLEVENAKLMDLIQQQQDTQKDNQQSLEELKLKTSDLEKCVQQLETENAELKKRNVGLTQQQRDIQPDGQDIINQLKEVLKQVPATTNDKKKDDDSNHGCILS